MSATEGGIRGATFSWSVATPEGTVASGECEFLVVPTAGGELGVLADHAALVACVVPGGLRVTESASPKADSASGGATAGTERTVSVGEGVVDVRDNRVRVLVTRAAAGGFGAAAGGSASPQADSASPQADSSAGDPSR